MNVYEEIKYLSQMLTATTVDDKQRLFAIESRLSEIRAEGVVGTEEQYCG